MEPKLQTLPQYYKTETSPMIQHSAFPPFKIEHRYRGVYERAGFDVNLKGDSPTSDVRSTRSPTMQRFQHSSNGMNSSNSSANSIGGSMKIDSAMPSSAKTSKSFGELQRRTPYPVYENRAHSESQPNTSQLPAISSAPSNLSYDQSQSANSVKPELPVVQIQQCDTPDNTELPPPSNSGFTFIPSTTQKKNLKNLSLNLNDPQSNAVDNSEMSENDDDSIPNESYDTSSETSVNNPCIQKDDTGSKRSSQSSIRTAELTSSQMQPVHGLPSPPPTSRSCELQPDNSLIKKQRLSSALNEFRKDIEDHKNYVPKTPSAPNTPTFGEAPQLPTSFPPNVGVNQNDSYQNPDNRFSYNQNYVNSANGDSLNKNQFVDQSVDPSNQFQNFRDQQLALGTQLNDEYQNFLQSGDKSQPRDSQVSMVSSILSKDSDYEKDEGADEAMERQLHALKMGENNNGNSVNETGSTAHNNDENLQDIDSNANIDNAPSSWGSSVPNSTPNVIPATIPTINIQNIDDDDSPISANHSFDDYDSQDRENATWESIKPLSVNNSERQPSSDISNDRAIDRQINVDESSEGIEVKPLSPKNHLVEEELRNMNFPVQQVPGSVDDNKEEISDDSFKYPSGKGPCRACRKEISPYSRGSEKAVFSKTGELSGQWHRSCFTCAYSGCTVQFSKSIQCYVYDDNAFCHNHYHELNDTLCQRCSKGIEGECVENELHQKWHLHCLTCHQCKCQINKDYYLINGASYCEEDAVKIIKEGGSYEDMSGNVKTGGLTTSDKVEKRRTRIMYVE